MASVAHTIGMAQHRETMIATSQPSGLNRKLRSDIGFSRCFIRPTAYRRCRSKAKRYASFRGRRDSTGTYTDRTSLVKPALVDFECRMTSSLRFKSLASMSRVRIYRKAFRRPSGFVVAQPAVAPCRYYPAPDLQVVQDERRLRTIRSTAYYSMTIGGIVRDRPVPVLYGLMIVSLAALLPLPPLLQDQSYHQFVDQRELFGIPNFLNVVSNLPFIAVGAIGLLRV